MFLAYLVAMSRAQEGVFDPMAKLVKFRVVRPLYGPVSLRRDDGLHALRGGVLKDSVGIVTFVRDQMVGVDPFDQAAGPRAIRSGAFCNKDSDRQTNRIHGQMGTVLQQGASMTLGTELSLMYQTGHPQSTDPAYEYKVIAGSYLHLPVIGESVSPSLLQDLKQRLESTKTKLQSKDQALIATLTREELLGDLFYAGGLGYFAQYTGMSHVLALPQRATHQLAFGYGSYGYEPNVDTFFGVPRAIKAGGAVMNIRIARQLGTHHVNAEQLKTLNLQVGLLSSALEHAVPELMFVTPDHPGEAISAAKALAKANAQGQRIYHLTPANQGAALPNIHHHPDTMAEIRTALANGLEVITHTDAVSVPGWSGAGYIIRDPATGSGALRSAVGGI